MARFTISLDSSPSAPITGSGVGTFRPYFSRLASVSRMPGANSTLVPHALASESSPAFACVSMAARSASMVSKRIALAASSISCARTSSALAASCAGTVSVMRKA